MSELLENEQFIRQFIIETEEHIENIESNLLKIENNIKNKEEFDKNAINELFRSIHTIKGLSGMLEFNNMLGLSHAWESLLDKVRKGKKKINQEIIDVSLDSSDLLLEMLNNIKDNGSDLKVDISKTLGKLNKILDSETKVKKATKKKTTKKNKKEVKHPIIDKLEKVVVKNLEDFDKEKLINAIENNKKIYQARIFLNKNCFDKGISYISTCINLEMMGEIISICCNIDKVPLLVNYDPKNFDLEVFIVFETDKNKADIYKIIKNEEIELKIITLDEDIAVIEEKKDSIDNVVKVADPLDNPIVVKNKNDVSETVKDKPKLDIKSNYETIRVETKRLDQLLSLLGEQVISKVQLEQLGKHLFTIINERNLNITEKLPVLIEISENFNDTINSYSRLSNELQETVMRLRMLPIGSVFSRFKRLVRDLSKDLNKKVNLIIEGEETELDKTIIEEISDPIIHILRNSIDHGIELPEDRLSKGKNDYGTIKISAYQEGNRIVITLQDDGNGLNLDKIKAKAIKNNLVSENSNLSDNEIVNLIFNPGFTTAEKVTGVSGRGVGMDVVKSNITKLKGTISVENSVGKGCTFILKLPLTLAIIQALLIQVSNYKLAIPLTNVVESYRANTDEIIYINNRPVLKLRDTIIPIFYLNEFFQINKKERKSDYNYIVVLAIAERKFGFVVDNLLGQQEIVIKPLNDPFVKVKGIAGATLLGQNIVLIMDPISIINSDESNHFNMFST